MTGKTAEMTDTMTDKKIKTITESFVLGWDYGSRFGWCSYETMDLMYPDVDEIAFREGMSDGIEGDTFRLPQQAAIQKRLARQLTLEGGD